MRLKVLRSALECLLAATQRPTQKAMGQGATRSQMDIRISLRVRERRDVDLILGQGMFNSGWHAHTLDAPGKFLVSAPEHPHPKRARAYLITDNDVAKTAERHAAHRPVLNQPRPPDLPRNRPEDPYDARPEPEQTGSPDERLWRALLEAPADGTPAATLAKITGTSRRTLYRRLDDYVRTGRAIQTRRGHYRATHPGDGHAA